MSGVAGTWRPISSSINHTSHGMASCGSSTLVQVSRATLGRMHTSPSSVSRADALCALALADHATTPHSPRPPRTPPPARLSSLPPLTPPATSSSPPPQLPHLPSPLSRPPPPTRHPIRPVRALHRHRLAAHPRDNYGELRQSDPAGPGTRGVVGVERGEDGAGVGGGRVGGGGGGGLGERGSVVVGGLWELGWNTTRWGRTLDDDAVRGRQRGSESAGWAP